MPETEQTLPPVYELWCRADDGGIVTTVRCGDHLDEKLNEVPDTNWSEWQFSETNAWDARKTYFCEYESCEAQGYLG